MLLLVTGCGAASDGRFTGTTVTDQGSCGPGYDGGQVSATLLLRDGAAEFAPNDGVVVLRGRLMEAGRVVARSDAPGADKRPFQQVFEGRLEGDRVEGQFATPRCRATVRLTRR